MTTSHIVTDIQSGILRIQIQRPDKKNAITQAMYSAMSAAIRQAEVDQAIHVVFITGTSDCFTSGNDLVDFLQLKQGHESYPGVVFLQTIANAEKPLVAAVNGLSIGIGTTLLLHCDLVYAGQSAKFQLPFVNLGLCPEAAASLLLPQLVGYHRAAEWLLLGEMFDAETACQSGVVNAVYPDAEVVTRAWEKAKQLASCVPNAVRITKSLLKRTHTTAINETITTEIQHFLALLEAPEAKQIMTMFLHKKKP